MPRRRGEARGWAARPSARRARPPEFRRPSLPPSRRRRPAPARRSGRRARRRRTGCGRQARRRAAGRGRRRSRTACRIRRIATDQPGHAREEQSEREQQSRGAHVEDLGDPVSRKSGDAVADGGGDQQSEEGGKRPLRARGEQSDEELAAVAPFGERAGDEGGDERFHQPPRRTWTEASSAWPAASSRRKQPTASRRRSK